MKAINTFINTLSLVGLSVVSREDQKLSHWDGTHVVVKDDNGDHIALSITNSYVGYAGKEVGVGNFLTKNYDSLQDALDALLELLIKAMDAGEWAYEKSPYIEPREEDQYTPKTVKIPEGTFEFKGKQTKIEEFEMCETCITWDDWEKYIEANPDADIPNDDAGFGRGSRPVVNVSWNDIQEYIKWLNKVTGEEWDLPTEEEWEYACRAGTTTDYYTGDSINITQANFYTDDVSIGKTTPVGMYPPNGYGLYDLHGNCWEFTSSVYGDDD
jgi:formylglycine-generating enzyme required for sulfatase activity